MKRGKLIYNTLEMSLKNQKKLNFMRLFKTKTKKLSNIKTKFRNNRSKKLKILNY